MKLFKNISDQKIWRTFTTLAAQNCDSHASHDSQR